MLNHHQDDVTDEGEQRPSRSVNNNNQQQQITCENRQSASLRSTFIRFFLLKTFTDSRALSGICNFVFSPFNDSN